jgi:predicted alpha/beta superfamily hydrolase
VRRPAPLLQLRCGVTSPHRKFATMLKLLFLLAFSLPLFAHDPERVFLDSAVLGEKRAALVELPQSYATGSQRYPVLFVTDGDTRAEHTADTAKALARVDRMPEVIVVGVLNTDRTRDLTPTAQKLMTVGGETQYFASSGGAAKFLSFFENALIPEIDRRYRTAPYRIFAGHSFGGLFALEMLFTRPKLFNAWIAVSPTVWWDEKYPLRRAEKFVAETPRLDGSLYLAVGNEEPAMTSTFRELEKLLTKKAPRGFTVWSEHFDDDDHGSVPLPAHYAALRKLFAPWHLPVDAPEDVTKAWARANEHAARLTKLYGYAIAVPEARANRIGYALLAAKRFDDAIAVFRANVSTYADSANVYDSLGDAYERAGDRQKALENYTLAVEKARAAKNPLLEIYVRNRDRMASSPSPR